MRRSVAAVRVGEGVAEISSPMTLAVRMRCGIVKKRGDGHVRAPCAGVTSRKIYQINRTLKIIFKFFFIVELN